MQLNFNASGQLVTFSSDAPTGAVVETGYATETEQLSQPAVQVMLNQPRPLVGGSVFGHKTMRDGDCAVVMVGSDGR
jgi:hypothetical protein